MPVPWRQQYAVTRTRPAILTNFNAGNVEFSLLEGLLDSFITDPEGGVLVRLGDRIPEGALARITAAQAVVAGFTVATECGLGRQDSAAIPAILEIQSSVADPL